ncbi:pescadillo [Tanacetum coccineum]
MDPNSSLRKICLGDDVIVISSDKVERSGDWNSLEYQDTTVSIRKKVMNALNFYRIETDEISKRYIAPCFVNSLEAFDGEVNLAFDENLISNGFAVKLYLDYEFIINPKEDDFEPGVILGRSFLRLAQGVVDFGNRVITIYPELDPFEDDSEKTEKSSDDWDQLLDFNFDDVPKSREELPPFICKMGKSNQEAAKEELAIRISQRYALLKEERLVIETMAYNDKYKKILDEIWKDKVELDGKTIKEDEEAVKRIKGEALKEKDDPGAFIFPIRLEGKVNKNALADTGLDINTMPYRIFKTLGREDIKKVDRGITMINHTQAEAIGKLSNVLCQVGVTTIIIKFLILDIPIDRDAPIVVGQGFLHTMGSILNASEIIFSTFDRVCHQTFRAARFDVLRTAESDSDDEEEYVIKRNKFGSPIYGLRPAPYLNCTNPEDRSSAIQTDVLNQMGCDGEIDDMLRIRVREAESKEENIIKFRLGGRTHSLTLLEFARRLGFYQADELEEDGFNVYFEGGYDKVQKNDLWLLSMFDARYQNGYANVARAVARWMKRKGAGTQKESQICRGQFISKLARKCRVLTEDVVRSLSAIIYCRDLDIVTLRYLIDFDGKLIPEDPQPGVPRVGIPRPPRASMQDLYDRMGRMEIRQDAIERMGYRQSYHWDRYHGVFEHMAGVYSVPLQRAYNPPGYAQP